MQENLNLKNVKLEVCQRCHFSGNQEFKIERNNFRKNETVSTLEMEIIDQNGEKENVSNLSY